MDPYPKTHNGASSDVFSGCLSITPTSWSTGTLIPVDDDGDDDDALISIARERRDAREEYRAPPFVFVGGDAVDSVVLMRADAVWRATAASRASLDSARVKAPNVHVRIKHVLSLGRSTTSTTTTKTKKERVKGKRDSGNEDDVDAVHVHDDTGWIFAQNQTITQTSVTR